MRHGAGVPNGGFSALKLDGLAGGGRGGFEQILQEAVLEAVDPTVDGQRVALFPGAAENGGVAEVAHLLDHVETAQGAGALVGRGQGIQIGGELFADIGKVPEPVADQPDLAPFEHSLNAAAAIVAADDDVLDPEHLDGVLDDREAVEVGMHDEIGDIAMDE